MDSKSLEIKLKKEMLKIDDLPWEKPKIVQILQINNALLYFGILMIQVNRETRKNISIKER